MKEVYCPTVNYNTSCYWSHFTITMVTRHYFKRFSFKGVFWLVKVSVNYTDPQYYGNN